MSQKNKQKRKRNKKRAKNGIDQLDTVVMPASPNQLREKALQEAQLKQQAQAVEQAVEVCPELDLSGDQMVADFEIKLRDMVKQNEEMKGRKLRPNASHEWLQDLANQIK